MFEKIAATILICTTILTVYFYVDNRVSNMKPDCRTVKVVGGCSRTGVCKAIFTDGTTELAISPVNGEILCRYEEDEFFR